MTLPRSHKLQGSTHDQTSWSCGSAELLRYLKSNPDTGLSTAEAEERQLDTGLNQLQMALPRTLSSIVTDQLKSVVILLLAAAAVMAFAFSNFVEGFTVLAVIVINSSIGFITEWRATRSMESLKELGRVDTTVLRDGIVQRVPAINLVPGDIVMLEGIDRSQL